MGMFFTKGVKDFYLGNYKVQKMYLGNALVWPIRDTFKVLNKATGEHIKFYVLDKNTGEHIPFKVKTL